jgi:purine-binding chemotaxis protein CheW
MTPLTIRRGHETVRESPGQPALKRPRSLLVFFLAGQAYGLPLRDVQEVLPMAQLTRPHDLPAALAGFLNLGGAAVPVLRLGRLFGLTERPPGLYTPLIVLRSPDTRLVLMADQVSGIVAVSDEEVITVPEDHSFNDCVVGMATIEGRVVLLLSPERLLLDKEQQCLAELQDREQARLREMEGPQR